MRLVLGSSAGTAPARGRGLWAVVVIVLALAVAGGGYLAGGHRPPPPPQPAVTSDISWSLVGPWPVPRSAGAGPARTVDGVATGFAHNELGAALAAVNITERLTSDAGPAISTATAREQTYGDVATMLTLIARSPTGGSSPAIAIYYKIVYGDPAGEDPVLISIAEQTPESVLGGGYFAGYRTLRWRAGDWRMQVPLSPSELLTSLPGYHLLGNPDV